mgnify:FL=1
MDAPDFSAPLLQAISALAEQVWILRDRERVLEEVLARHGLDVREEVTRFQPDAAMTRALDEERRTFINAVLQSFGESRSKPNPP